MTFTSWNQTTVIKGVVESQSITNTPKHTHTHTNTHMHTHIHTYTCSLYFPLSVSYTHMPSLFPSLCHTHTHTYTYSHVPLAYRHIATPLLSNSFRFHGQREREREIKGNDGRRGVEIYRKNEGRIEKRQVGVEREEGERKVEREGEKEGWSELELARDEERDGVSG